MSKPIRIHVTGDAYRAIFFARPGQIVLDDMDSNQAIVQVMPVGVEYISRAIRAASNPFSLLQMSGAKASRKISFSSSRITITRNEGQGLFQNGKPITALYELRNVDGKSIDDSRVKKPLPLLRLANVETQEIALPKGLLDTWLPCGKNSATKRWKREASVPRGVLVHWIGELAKKNRNNWKCKQQKCKIHIQVGLCTCEHDESTSVLPAGLAKPEYARIIVVNVGEISSDHRIRKSLSYEAIAVDLLRHLRGDDAQANWRTKTLKELSMSGPKSAPLSVLAVRLNNSAVFLYACRNENNKPFQEIGAWLLCHKQECAPLSLPELGQMVGYTGFVSAHIASAVGNYLGTLGNFNDKRLIQAIRQGVKRSLAWQRLSFEHGCGHMLFQLKEVEQKWESTSGDVKSPLIGYDHMFADIIRTFQKKHGCKSAKILNKHCENQVHDIEVQIARAVAHRTQWFMARSVAQDPAKDDSLEAEFTRIASSWLSKGKNQPAIDDPDQSSIPIVHIGDAQLTDRREVEDYLAIRQALIAYASADEARPLNLAVFGSPGSGKSFAVRQVVKHLSGEAGRVRFKPKPLTFNLGEFKSLDDLPAALHLVRNECLSREIPIVFFDEFDSSFQGQPFGWLKYFLAPMQDGEFYHSGQNYKMGRAVFVFAGGVNRSFEELNGRLRNPGFCEAKGPDFISRLKAHLNVQGINKPEDETDQHRYILGRGVKLRDIVRRRMGLKDKQKIDALLHPSVANALLKIERFKHGVRSLEAIIAMCHIRPGYPIGPSDLPSLDQLDMHVDAVNLLRQVDSH